jgi:hypothetical protein
MARIVFEVTSMAVQEDLLVLTRDGRPVQLQLADGKAAADLPEGGYDLFWSLRGPPGAPFRVQVRQGDTVLVEAHDAIPARNLRQAGGAYFGVKGREAIRALKDCTAVVTPLYPAAVAVRAAQGARYAAAE